MRTRGQVLALLLSVAGAAVARAAPPPPAVLFSLLRRYRGILSSARYRLLVVEILQPKDPRRLRGTHRIRLRAVADVVGKGRGFKPQDISVVVSLSSTRELAPSLEPKRYLALLRAYARDGKTTWQILTMHYREHGVGRGATRYYYLMGIDRPEGPLIEAIRRLLLRRGASGETFKDMLGYLRSEDKQTREFAAAFAGMNGWGYTGSPGQKHQPDAFARALLEQTDASARRLLVGAYSRAKADLLPRDEKLLGRVFAHEDPEVTAAALGANLRLAAARAGALRPFVRRVLLGHTSNPSARRQVLAALGAWKQKALAFRAELEALARGEMSGPVEPVERLLALHVLLDNKVPDAPDLVLTTLTEVPSAVALQYAVSERLGAVVPAVIRAVRESRLVWSGAHSAALSLLTRRFPDGDFGQFDRWWAQVERSGQEQAVLRSGFADARVQTRAARLIDQLGSDSYRRRLAARKALMGLGTTVLPALRAAARRKDAEISVTATELINTVETKFENCRKRLAAAVSKERAGSEYLPRAGGAGGGQAPLTQPASKAQMGDKGSATPQPGWSGSGKGQRP